VLTETQPRGYYTRSLYCVPVLQPLGGVIVNSLPIVLTYGRYLDCGIHNPKTRKSLTLLTKQVAAIAVLLGFFDDSICTYTACGSLYLNSRHNTVANPYYEKAVP
jgi:hypothetical protein